MALITCPECGREISDRAEACPNCGFPITKSEEMDNELQVSDVVLAKEEQNPPAATKEKSEGWTHCDVMCCAGGAGLFLVTNFQ